MNRTTVYSGEVPRTVDVLQLQQSAMVGLAKLSMAAIGSSGFAEGFSCGPNSPAALNVILGAGQVYQSEPLEATNWSALLADTTHNIVKQGIALDQQIISLTPPSTTGFSQVFLIEVQYQDADAGSTVLPYYNAANPAAPFSGPGNSGTAQNTARNGVAAVQVKAGTAATTGTQIPPIVDSGWIALWYVTLAQGQTTITSGNIARVPNAPVLGETYMPKLPALPAYMQSGAWGYVADTSGAANSIAVAPTPPLAALSAGAKITVKVANAVTGATTLTYTLAGGSTNTSPVVHGDGTALLANDLVAGQLVEFNFDGSNWQMPRASGSVAANQLTTSAVGMNQPINCQIQASVSTGALTVTIVSASGAALSSSNPMLATFRDATAANGDPVTRIVTSNLTFTVNSGNTLGTVSAVCGKLWVVLIDNGGTVLVGLINCNGQTTIFPLVEESLASTGSGTGGGNSAGVIYTSVASLSGKAIRIIGNIEWTTALATAGTWNNAPNVARLYSPGMKKPGDVVQAVYSTSSSATLTPTSAANLVEVFFSLSVNVPTSATVGVGFNRNATSIFTTSIGVSSGIQISAVVSETILDNPNSVAGLTYAASLSAGTSSHPNVYAKEIVA